MCVKLNGENLKILICCYKPNDILPDDPDGIFLPVYCGAAINDNAVVEAQLQGWQKAGGGGQEMICLMALLATTLAGGIRLIAR